MGDQRQRRRVISLDPATGTFKRWPRQATLKFRVGGTLTVDPEGNPWAPAGDGAIKLDVKTGQYSEYAAPTTGKGTYGILTDSRGNIWYSQPGGDRVVKVDSKTGKSTEVVVGGRDLPFITQFDIEAYNTFRANQNVGTPQMRAPRRGAGDPKNDYLWWGEFSANRLLRIDARDNSRKEYPLPIPYSMPYAVTVDKNHQVWINMISTDRVARFDPATEKFTDYVLPTRGTESVTSGIDDRPAVPEVWICRPARQDCAAADAKRCGCWERTERSRDHGEKDLAARAARVFIWSTQTCAMNARQVVAEVSASRIPSHNTLPHTTHVSSCCISRA